MSFEIRQDGEVVHTLDAPVNRIGIATEKGIVTWINSQDIGWVDLVVEYVNPGVVRLDQLETAQAQERAKIAQTVDVQGGSSVPSPDRDLAQPEADAAEQAQDEQIQKNTEAIEKFQSEANTDNVPVADENGIVDYNKMYEEGGKSNLNEALEDIPQESSTPGTVSTPEQTQVNDSGFQFTPVGDQTPEQPPASETTPPVEGENQ